MEELSVPYGRGSLTLRLPADLTLEIIQPAPVAAPRDQQAEIQRALSHPLGGIHADCSSAWAQLDQAFDGLSTIVVSARIARDAA